MLIDRRNFWKLHGRWMIGAVCAALAAAAWTIVAGRQSGRYWPGGGSASGLALGVIAALIFVFELALAAKKTTRFRTARWAGAAQTWMKAHIWLGLLTVPLVALHSGGRLGGVLTMVLVTLFAVVIVSGVWGLLMQNLLPRILLDAAPAETIYSQIRLVGEQYAADARRLVILACDPQAEDLRQEREREELAAQERDRTGRIRGAARRVGTVVTRLPQSRRVEPAIPSEALRLALQEHIEPFLRSGSGRRGQLGSRQRNQWYFDDLRSRVPSELAEVVGKLEELCERRRQLNVQSRMHFWLHNWLWLHLPLSVALIVVLVGHIVFALRFS